MQNILFFFSNPLNLNLPWLGSIDVMPSLISLLTFFALVFSFKFVRFVVLVRLRSLAARSENTLDDVVVSALESISAITYSYVSFFVALLPFVLTARVWFALKSVLLLILLWQSIVIIQCFITYAVSRWVEVDADGDGEIDSSSATSSDLIRLISGILLWLLGGLFVLSNLGIEVTSLLAGLGIGGIAVAFALQGVLSDLFASFSIYFDKPFRLGDYVVLGADSGTVEKIGIKSTRIRTLQGEELVVSNSELTTARVQNFKKMQRRRIVSRFGIAYETPVEKVEAVTQMVRDIFASIDKGELDRVHFTLLADSALQFEVVYFVHSSEYSVYLDIQQAFNLELMRIFQKNDIVFAYPTQTIYHKAA